MAIPNILSPGPARKKLRSGTQAGFLAALLLTGFLTAAAAGTGLNADGLAVRWELASRKPRNLEKLTFFNKGSAEFPWAGWTMYFNCFRDIDPGSASGGAVIERVNGDIYKLSPIAGFPPGPGQARVITYTSEGEVLNYTAAPSGLYLVPDSDPEKGLPITDLSYAPLNDPEAGFIKPEDIYLKNAAITDIPEERLIKILPTPASYKELPGTFELGPDTRIEADPEFGPEARYLAAEMAKLPGAGPGKAGSRLVIALKKAAMGDEAYRLSVNAEAAVISASTRAGIFYGIQSLKALIPPAALSGAARINIPAVEVEDAPRFGFRSLLLDVARNFKSKEEIFKVLDLMAFYKLNVLHFHIADDEGWRLEIRSLPELTEIGAKRGHTAGGAAMLPPSYGAGPEPGRTLASGYYTRADFIEILRYAGARHISVMPEIEAPGHARAAIKAMDARYERLSKLKRTEEAGRYLLRDPEDRSEYRTPQGWTDNVLCAALPSVYGFLEVVVDEIQAMYREAGAPLDSIHMGGDEVPDGAWKKSPACLEFVEKNPSLKTTDGLWHYFYARVNALLKARGLALSGWEELGLRKAPPGGGRAVPEPDFAGGDVRLHVWNNMIGWGSEDLPYRLANAGYKVILSCVSNNYLDLAYSKSPDEPGYYWGGFQDLDKPFYFVPYDYYRTTKEDAAGNPADPMSFSGKERLSERGRANIYGIQGLLWGENLRTNESLEYMLLPKLLALAERAWAPDPEWAREKDEARSRRLYDSAWSGFVNVVGKRELPRLDHMAGGFGYRIPPPGAVSRGGRVYANAQLPALTLRYTADGTEPTAQSRIYSGPIAEKGQILIRCFNALGRGGRTITVENK